MISSTSNKQIKNIIALQKKAALRNEESCFIIEGIKLFTEVPAHRLRKSYVTAACREAMTEEQRDKLETSDYELVSEEVFKKISDTVTPQGILSVIQREETSVQKLLHNHDKGLYLLLEDINDPGNLGTILRTCEAAGASGLIMSRHTVDIYNPKVVRSTMGAIFRMPFTYVEDLEATIRLLQQSGVRVYAAHLRGTEAYYEKDYDSPTAFIIGNESNGISEAVAQTADELLKIPMAGSVESLNAACAATVFLYEAFRQRLQKK